MEDPQEQAYIDYIIVNGEDPVTAFSECYGFEQGMDEFQINQRAQDFYRSMAGKIARRRLILRDTGLYDSMQETKCTEKELIFVHAYLNNGGSPNRLIKSYEEAYSTKGLTKAGIQYKASKLLQKKSVKAAIEQYRKNLESEFEYSLGEYVRELNENREKAKSLGQVAAMNAATLEKGKVFGYSDKKILGTKENPMVVNQNFSIEDILNEAAERRKLREQNQQINNDEKTE